MYNKNDDNCLASQRYNNLDLLKFICAFFVVCIHAPFSGEIGEYITAIARIAVPLFFMITGFFFTGVVECGKENLQIIKVLKLVIIANGFYFVWNAALNLIAGKSFFGYISEYINAESLFKLILLNVSPFSGHLWYLEALLYVLLIAKLLNRYNLLKRASRLIPLLLVADLIFGKYSLCILGREFPVDCLRNWLFVGLPYFLLGTFVKRNEDRLRLYFCNRSLLLLGSIVMFTITTMFERLMLLEAGLNATRDHYISSTLLALVVILSCIISKDVGEGNILAIKGREDSAFIYIIHPAIVTCFAICNRLFDREIWNLYYVARPVIVFLVALLASTIKTIVARKIRILIHI